MTDANQAAPANSAGGEFALGELSDAHREIIASTGIKSAAEALDKLSGLSSKIDAPKDGQWSDEARKALGIPEAPDKYELTPPKLPEGMPWDTDLEASMREVAHKHGITPAQLQALADAFGARAASQFEAMSKINTETAFKAETELKREWGQSYARKLDLARRAAVQFGGETAIGELEASGLGNHPALIRMMAKIGEAIGEDRLRNATSGSSEKRDPATVLYG